MLLPPKFRRSPDEGGAAPRDDPAWSPAPWDEWAAASARTVPAPSPERTDFWLVAGQSNMLGQCAIRAEPAMADQRVLIFGTDHQWRVAQEPTMPYWFPHGDAFGRAVYPNTQTVQHLLNNDPRYGQSLGVSFAHHLVQHLDRDIGLVGCVTGGTMKAKWNPAARDAEGRSFYADAMRYIRQANRPFKGVVWYQGESDAVTPEDVGAYEETCRRFIEKMRADLGDSQLPFVCVQIGRLACGKPNGSLQQSAAEVADRSWETVRELQRQIAANSDTIFLVSGIDLPLDDPIHVSGVGLQRLGRRVAEVALSQVYGRARHATPIRLGAIELMDAESQRPRIRIRFAGVTGRLRSSGNPTGFELRFSPEKAKGPVVFAVELDPENRASVILRTTGPLTGPVSLIHGVGRNPYINITDEADMVIPAFGANRDCELIYTDLIGGLVC